MKGEKIAIAICAAIGIAILVFMFSGCGAKANDLHAEAISGPNGTACYAIIQNGLAVGGNCK